MNSHNIDIGNDIIFNKFLLEGCHIINMTKTHMKYFHGYTDLLFELSTKNIIFY